MIAKVWSNVLFPIAVFVVAAGLVYFAITRWRDDPPEKTYQHTIEGIQGLNQGELVTLPVLTKFSGESISLDRLNEKHILCVFITPSCSGCAKDVDLWRDLYQQATRRGVAFFIVDVGSDRDALDGFADAYNLQSLPMLFDPNHQIGRSLKINFVPQYLLFTNGGKVISRWDGVRGYDRETGQKQLAEFFPPASDLSSHERSQ